MSTRPTRTAQKRWTVGLAALAAGLSTAVFIGADTTHALTGTVSTDAPLGQSVRATSQPTLGSSVAGGHITYR